MMPDKLADAFVDTIITKHTVVVGETPDFEVCIFLMQHCDCSEKFYIVPKEKREWYLHSDGIIRNGTSSSSGRTGYYDTLADCQLAIHKYRELQETK